MRAPTVIPDMTAIIDIGSNSVRLMLWAGGALYKKIQTTRLGEGLATSGRLSPAAIERTVSAVCSFYREGKDRGAAVYAFATAAVRSSENGSDFLSRVKELTGLDVDVVSGEEEALLGLCGACGESDGGVIDVGGASTEICLRKGGNIVLSRSLPIGAVRLLDLCGQEPKRLLNVIEKEIAPLPSLAGERFYAIGGTSSTLACLKLGLVEYDAEKIGDLVLKEEEVGALARTLLSLSPQKRREFVRVDPRRADILGGGALLLFEIIKKLAVGEVRVSDRDNLEGYLALRGLV